MTDEIHLEFAMKEVNNIAVLRHLTLRHYGWIGALMVPASAVGAVGLLSVFVQYGIQINVLSVEGIAGIYVTILGFIFAGLMNRLQQLRAYRVRQASPIRQFLEHYTVGPSGLRRNGTDLPWALFTGVSEMPGATLNCISPQEAVVLLHKRLLGDVTPQILNQRVAEWRAAASAA
jgi:hypothetical protein